MYRVSKKMAAATLVAATLVAGSAVAAGIDSAQITRPEGTEAHQGDRAELVALGEKLWNDPALSKKGKTSCASCHTGNTKMFKKTFLDAYPHTVAMAKSKARKDQITAEGMVQFCMLAPMKNNPLPWESKELAALTAYTVDVVQKAYVESKSK